MAQGDAELQDLYREVLLDYFRSSAHRGAVEGAELVCEGKNPLCGDEVVLSARLEGGRIAELRHEGLGCVISQAATAMLVEALEGQPLDKAEALARRLKDWMLGRGELGGTEELEEFESLAGVRRFPVRIKCAILAANTFLEGLKARSEGRTAVFKEV